MHVTLRFNFAGGVEHCKRARVVNVPPPHAQRKGLDLVSQAGRVVVNIHHVSTRARVAHGVVTSRAL